MGFTKRYYSKDSLKLKADNCKDFKDFLNYFKVDSIILEDDFSYYIFEKIKKCKVKNEEEITEIINECKKI